MTGDGVAELGLESHVHALTLGLHVLNIPARVQNSADEIAMGTELQIGAEQSVNDVVSVVMTCLVSSEFSEIEGGVFSVVVTLSSTVSSEIVFIASTESLSFLK